MRTAIAVLAVLLLASCEQGRLKLSKVVDEEHGVVCYHFWGDAHLSCVKVK